jgi:hypothetical protein
VSARLIRAVIALVLIVAVVAVAGFAAYNGLKRLFATPPPPPGCTANVGAPYPLAFDQAGIAATIAAIGERRHLPERAVTIALSTALQESDLENLSYGDRDSVGVFQQRPSQGWGTVAEIENPIYATGRFYSALVKVPRYTKIPVATAAQDVQHSADGSAYGQWAYIGGQLAADFTGAQPRQVTCWYVPAANTSADLTGTSQGMRAAFGPQLQDTVSRTTLAVKPLRGEGWATACWLVAHAQQYQLTQVRYAGYVWKAANGSMGWQRSAGSPAVSNLDLVAS